MGQMTSCIVKGVTLGDTPHQQRIIAQLCSFSQLYGHSEAHS